MEQSFYYGEQNNEIFKGDNYETIVERMNVRSFIKMHE
jgi:hypothetical protein